MLDETCWSRIPNYRKVPNTRFIVDHFKPELPKDVTACFLTHWHHDHYDGLQSSFSLSPIYCSPVTASLLEKVMYLNPSILVAKEYEEPFVVEDTRITFLDANHCPGSVMILFETPFGNYLHTGDMRFTERMKQNPFLGKCALDIVYLDTTYCHQKHCFPSQQTTIQQMLQIIQHSENEKDAYCSMNTLHVIATYSIGKEKLLDALIRNGYRLYVSEEKWKILSYLAYWSNEELLECFTTDPTASHIWIIGWKKAAESVPWGFLPNFENLSSLLEFSNGCKYGYEQGELLNGTLHQVVAFIPTGWAWKKNKNWLYLQQKDNRFFVYGIPYSEHSNFGELQRFIGWLKPKQVIPTVPLRNGDKSNRNIGRMFQHLLDDTVRHKPSQA
eukprot:jgi/Galph1/4279/GphlegSOOS_G2920.1